MISAAERQCSELAGRLRRKWRLAPFLVHALPRDTCSDGSPVCVVLRAWRCGSWAAGDQIWSSVFFRWTLLV